jgi:hypothetical protein
MFYSAETASTRGGLATASVTVVPRMICTLLCGSDKGTSFSMDRISYGSVRNSPAASVP